MKYDVTLKEILQAGAPKFWQALAGEQPAEFLTVELPSVQIRKPDLLARLEGGALFHLELQSDNESEMEWRELEYYVFIYRLCGQPPIQCVLYFGLASLTMRSRLVNESLQFRYTLIDLRELHSSEYFLASESLSDAALALLAKPENLNQQQVIEAVAEKLKILPTKEQRDWLERIMILSGLRGAEDMVRAEVEKMGISLDIRDNKFFQEAYAAGIEDGVEKGIEKGIEKGVEKGEVSLLRRQLERRFGSLPDWVMAQLEKADRSKLEDFGLRFVDAKQLEDVFNGSLSGTN
ncbi:MAG: DUF4351 domain-containing protein [Acidobacteriota bacterium]